MQLLENDFYFMRHGTTASNLTERIGGSNDEPLTEEGLKLAVRQAAKLRGIEIGSIWVSTLMRTRQTAKAVSTVCSKPTYFLPELQERNWGVMEGRPRSELVREAKPDGGEGPEEFRARIRLGLSQITGPAPVLIIAHSGTAREIAALLEIKVARPDNCDILHFQNVNCHWNVKNL